MKKSNYTYIQAVYKDNHVYLPFKIHNHHHQPANNHQKRACPIAWFEDKSKQPSAAMRMSSFHQLLAPSHFTDKTSTFLIDPDNQNWQW